jgi:hypothetical protein
MFTNPTRDVIDKYRLVWESEITSKTINFYLALVNCIFYSLSSAGLIESSLYCLVMSGIKAALKAAKTALDAENYDLVVTQCQIVLASDAQNYFAYVASNTE